ncbi:diguanylate cyclase [Pseudomonas sp. SA3-5]|uniref:Diguanylate cyclase n=1 Tax=Pseudomonas aestuarii TaxID=3018340 RepID=A0ABT4X9H5_9PSED|nr:diguanylate cyclase [Pseudomonas aestuarii]MDA7085032.1 diguanylate cyclase [Pseudomonas aestuarii]
MVGDRPLIEVTVRLRAFVRGGEPVARLRGNEFILLGDAIGPGIATLICQAAPAMPQRKRSAKLGWCCIGREWAAPPAVGAGAR